MGFLSDPGILEFQDVRTSLCGRGLFPGHSCLSLPQRPHHDPPLLVQGTVCQLWAPCTFILLYFLSWSPSPYLLFYFLGYFLSCSFLLFSSVFNFCICIYNCRRSSLCSECLPASVSAPSPVRLVCHLVIVFVLGLYWVLVFKVSSEHPGQACVLCGLCAHLGVETWKLAVRVGDPQMPGSLGLVLGAWPHFCRNGLLCLNDRICEQGS